MSSNNDPVTFILDTVNTWKHEGVKVFNKTVETVKDTQAFEYVEGVITGTKQPFITHGVIPAAAPPPSAWERTTNWIHKHKWLVGLIAVGATGGTAYYIYTINTCKRTRRRAKKVSNGARKEVVLIAGSPSEGITQILADDLNKRGFIVYHTTSSPEEEQTVLEQNCADIRPLPIKAQEASSIQETSKNLENILNTPVQPFENGPTHKLSLTGVLVVPDLYFPAGPVESIRADTWSDLVYSKILGPIFLLSNGLLDVVRKQNSRVILLTPSIMGSLNPAFHSAECITANALSSLALCLHRELEPHGVPVVHMRLGSFDIRPGRKQTNQQRQITNGIRADVLSWPERLRSLYAQSYQASAHLQTARASGSNLRVLHHAVFDALTQTRPKRVWYVGKGSYSYKWLNDTIPENVMSWLLQPHFDFTRPDDDWEAV